MSEFLKYEEQARNLLLPPSIYRDLVNEKGPFYDVGVPWFHRLDVVSENSPKQLLTVTGSRHQTIADFWYNKFYTEAIKEWDRDTDTDNRVIITEAPFDQLSMFTGRRPIIEAIDRSAEGAMFYQWAYDHNIPIVPGRNIVRSELPGLLEEFSPDLINFYYALSLLTWTTNQNYETMLRDHIQSLQQKVGHLAMQQRVSQKIEFTYEGFLKAYIEHFGEMPRPDDPDMKLQYIKYTSAELEPDENFRNHPLGQVATKRMMYHNIYLGSVTAYIWAQGKSVMIVHGSNHTMALTDFFLSLGRHIPVSDRIASHRLPNGVLASDYLLGNTRLFRRSTLIEPDGHRSTSLSYLANTYNITQKSNELVLDETWPAWPRVASSSSQVPEIFEAIKKLPILTPDKSLYLAAMAQPYDTIYPDITRVHRHLAKYGEEMLPDRPDQGPSGVLPTALKRIHEALPRHHKDQAVEEYLRSLIDAMNYRLDTMGKSYAMSSFNTMSKHIAALGLLFRSDVESVGVKCSALQMLNYIHHFLNNSMQRNFEIAKRLSPVLEMD